MPFRLLHTADLLLDVPLVGVGPLPRPLFERVRDAPMTTLDHLVGAALHYQVDAVAVAGGIALDPSDTRAAAGLARAIDRLTDAGVTTIVALTRRDGEDLPTPPGWEPHDAVTVVPPATAAAVTVERGDDAALAVVVGGEGVAPDQLVHAAAGIDAQAVVALVALPWGQPPPRLDPDAFGAWMLGGAAEPYHARLGAGSWMTVAATPQPRWFGPSVRRADAFLLEHDRGLATPRALQLADVAVVHVWVDLDDVDRLEDVAHRATQAANAAHGPDQAAMLQLVLAGESELRRPLGGLETRQELLDQLRSQAMTAGRPRWWADVVVAPLQPAARDALASRSPAARAVLGEAQALEAADPHEVLAHARRAAGIPGWERAPLPQRGAWAGLVDEAAVTALDLLAERSP